MASGPASLTRRQQSYEIFGAALQHQIKVRQPAGHAAGQPLADSGS
jgi:hypothetical protein